MLWNNGARVSLWSRRFSLETRWLSTESDMGPHRFDGLARSGVVNFASRNGTSAAAIATTVVQGAIMPIDRDVDQITLKTGAARRDGTTFEGLRLRSKYDELRRVRYGPLCRQWPPVNFGETLRISERNLCPEVARRESHNFQGRERVHYGVGTIEHIENLPKIEPEDINKIGE
ncbi:MAG: hypothetical protein QOE55_2095 [Acidobacteriaceae bacterium]|jgi:hypothetical protein|nr:hypothetical protein [Acidobacteriaceae bacterium]